MSKRKRVDPLPDEFSSYEEAADFWSEHDTTDYPEAFAPEGEVVEAELPERSPLTVAQEEELDRRLAAYRKDRQPGEPWREALAKIDREELVRRHRQGYERHPVKPGEFHS